MRTQALIAANPDARPSELMKLLAAAWQAQVRRQLCDGCATAIMAATVRHEIELSYIAL